MTFNPSQRIKEFSNPERFEFEEVNCYVCNSNSPEEFIVGEDDLTGKEGKFLYVQCRECQTVYQNPRLNLNSIKEFYDSEYIAHRKKKDWGILTPLYEWAMNKHDRDKEKLISKHISLSNSSKVLDVGCAVGTFLLHIKKKTGCAISGVDFKEDLNYPGFETIDFHQGLFYEQNLPENHFDLVSMWHFLEHDYDPAKSLQMAKKVMKEDGILAIEVPRLDSFSFKLFKNKWPGIQAPQHTVLFDKKSFLRIIEDNGFEIEKYMPYGAFPPYFYLFTGTYFKLFGKGLKLNKIIFPYFLGQLILTPVLLFSKYLNLSMQTVICKRKD
jgi:SAM-dependent methyltransferase